MQSWLALDDDRAIMTALQLLEKPNHQPVDDDRQMSG